jgi:hypothetical protein
MTKDVVLTNAAGRDNALSGQSTPQGNC